MHDTHRYGMRCANWYLLAVHGGILAAAPPVGMMAAVERGARAPRS
jgi:hypothetical protein